MTIEYIAGTVFAAMGVFGIVMAYIGIKMLRKNWRSLQENLDESQEERQGK